MKATSLSQSPLVKSGTAYNNRFASIVTIKNRRLFAGEITWTHLLHGRRSLANETSPAIMACFASDRSLSDAKSLTFRPGFVCRIAVASSFMVAVFEIAHSLLRLVPSVAVRAEKRVELPRGPRALIRDSEYVGIHSSRGRPFQFSLASCECWPTADMTGRRVGSVFRV